jgi:chromosome partitioning protein
MVGMAEGVTGDPRGEEPAHGACCSVCGKEFQPKFKYQIQERDGELVAFCSAKCQLRAMTSADDVRCSVCSKAFVPNMAYQSAVFDGRRLHFCSMECRNSGSESPTPLKRLAVYNLKGGTGKTTTAVSLAAGLAALGRKILLVDGDPQGSVSVSLGVTNRRGLYQVLVLGTSPPLCTVKARENLDVMLSDRSLAASEVFLASRPDRYRVMRDRLAGLQGYDLIIIDCSPSLGLLSQNALRCADALIAPVSCDYLGVVGLEQAVQTVEDLKRRTGHGTRLIGVLPTFYDSRLIVCREAMDTMNQRYGDAMLEPIRINVQLREAPAQKLSIFEHAARSTGAEDYQKLAEWLDRTHLPPRQNKTEGDDEGRAPSMVSTGTPEMVSTGRESEAC